MTEQGRQLFSAGEAAGIIGAASRGNLEAPVRTVVVDSRKASLDSLFIALPGERADGHDYIEAALARGAKTVLAAESQKEKSLSGPFLPPPLPGPALFSPTLPCADFRPWQGSIGDGFSSFYALASQGLPARPPQRNA